ncbi:MAG: methyltransferase domain-containing protein [Actinomycetota bacterium]|nr:methyltransferase domain-containing protein [Actinomycetota bacterium]
MDLETFGRLLSPTGQSLLAEINSRAGMESDLALGTRLRKAHDVEFVAAAVTQNHLRGKARTKFGDSASQMYFTHDALEQSTRAVVSSHRTERLVSAGATAVVDLGCGIGGDLVAFARAGLSVRGVELDPVRAAIAQANLDALGLTGTVVCGDATAVAVTADEVAFVDPARRDGKGRIFDPTNCVPPWDFVTALLAGKGVAKTMPGIDHRLIPSGAEAEWVSDGGDLVEACLWGEAFASAHRRATILPSRETLTDADDESAAIGAPGTYLYEPDDAAIRSGLVTAVAARVGGWLIDPKIAYVSSDDHVPTPFARAFRVVDELPYREKPLKAALVARDVGTLTIKKRGVDVVPEALIRRLKLKGSVTATLIMTRVQDEGRAFLVEPL